MEQPVSIRGRTFRVHASSLTVWKRFARAAMAASSAFRNESFWRRVAAGRTESGTFAAIERFLDPAGTFIDLGAWIGAMSLFAARIGRRCFAIEPDPLAFAQLSANVALNPDLAPRIVPCNVAIWGRTGPLAFGTASSLGDSQSSAHFTESSQTLPVPALTIEDFVRRHRIRDLSFMKIDIEGGETVVLPAMERFLRAAKPSLYVSLHPSIFPRPRDDAERIIAVLGIYRHLWSPSGRKIDAAWLRRRLRLKLNYDLVASDREWD
jgi:FkbM family methyltransferase